MTTYDLEYFLHLLGVEHEYIKMPHPPYKYVCKLNYDYFDFFSRRSFEGIVYSKFTDTKHDALFSAVSKLPRPIKDELL